MSVDFTVLVVKLSRTFYKGRWQRETFWAVQAGLLTPLTFTRHRLSPLAAFTSGAYFQSSHWKAVTVNSPALKAFLKAHSQSVSGTKQERCSCYRMPKTKNKNAAFPPRLNLQSSGQPKNDARTLSFSHPPSPFPCNFRTRDRSGICTASQFYVQLPLLYTASTNAYSEISPEVAAATFRDFLRKRLGRAFTRANYLR